MRAFALIGALGLAVACERPQEPVAQVAPPVAAEAAPVAPVTPAETAPVAPVAPGESTSEAPPAPPAAPQQIYVVQPQVQVIAVPTPTPIVVQQPPTPLQTSDPDHVLHMDQRRGATASDPNGTNSLPAPGDSDSNANNDYTPR